MDGSCVHPNFEKKAREQAVEGSQEWATHKHYATAQNTDAAMPPLHESSPIQTPNSTPTIQTFREYTGLLHDINMFIFTQVSRSAHDSSDDNAYEDGASADGLVVTANISGAEHSTR